MVKYIRQTCETGIAVSHDKEELLVNDVSSFADTVRNLQQKIHENYCLELTGMYLNVEKSKIMLFRNDGPVNTFEKWTFNGF